MSNVSNESVSIDWEEVLKEILSGTITNLRIPENSQELRFCDISKTIMNSLEELNTLTINVPSSYVHGTDYLPKSFMEDNPFIENLIIENNVLVEDQTFKNCTNLKSVTFSFCSIGFETFYGCTSLVDLNFTTNLGVIEDCAFENCTSLQEVVFPKTVGYMECAVFRGCTALNHVELPEIISVSGRTYIDYQFFYGCSNLEEVTIPSCFTSLGSQIFVGCSKLNSLILKSQTPPLVNANTFSGLPTTCVITVPKGCLDVYKGSENYPNPSIYTYIEDE